MDLNVKIQIKKIRIGAYTYHIGYFVLQQRELCSRQTQCEDEHEGAHRGDGPDQNYLRWCSTESP